jgi:glycosyltransferase involved in cell wall biosynthesis
VVAFAAGAVADTVGDGGIVVREKRHAEIGALLAKVAQPGDLRSTLIERARARTQHFSYERFAARVAELLDAQGTNSQGIGAQRVEGV